jgi:hypothetical protein
MPSGAFLLGCGGLEIQHSNGDWFPGKVIDWKENNILVEFKVNGARMEELIDHQSPRIKLPEYLAYSTVGKGIVMSKPNHVFALQDF